MLIPGIRHDRSGLSFFRALPVYVLFFEDDDGDPCLVTEKTEQGQAVVCFLSSFDAMIEAAHAAICGWFYDVLPASDVDWRVFRDADRLGLIADVHLGWPWFDSGILVRPSGRPARVSRLMHHWARVPLTFEVNPVILAEYSRIRELAGLFAWQETHRELLNWDSQRLHQVAGRALGLIELKHGDPNACRQIAVFDPEFEQWHWVPFSQAP
ncbi:hypothetical protein [Paraburkholderia ginsengisoli]|uniref:Uncharacterized protein n=1 Tax=Paraburkholderia ginsengisoli TaxID=311231 RepID=A0A7T4N8T6_9BURK|nr:hypothetical protein [Paraburkholderia ginsengisoli]QQC67348.1 hypothetical protein I6I06_20605 [Paraburkholderia ginsengisoli]